MSNNYFGDLNLGNERSSSTTNSSSRKGKKSNSDKANKQPQRGLGVAQLEKIRLLNSQMPESDYLPPSNHHHQEDSSGKTAYSFGFPVQQKSFMMGLSEMGNMRYPDSGHQSSRTLLSRWNHGNALLEDQYLTQPSMTEHFPNQEEEHLVEERRNKDKIIDSMGSSSQHTESSGNQELDLELRL